jgi:endonuclease I
MMARYNDTNLDLTISEKIPTSSGEVKIGKLSTLIKWHYQDPVSFEEINRNEIFYKYQKNRNPCIDHPQ